MWTWLIFLKLSNLFKNTNQPNPHPSSIQINHSLLSLDSFSQLSPNQLFYKFLISILGDFNIRLQIVGLLVPFRLQPSIDVTVLLSVDNSFEFFIIPFLLSQVKIYGLFSFEENEELEPTSLIVLVNNFNICCTNLKCGLNKTLISGISSLLFSKWIMIFCCLLHFFEVWFLLFVFIKTKWQFGLICSILVLGKNGEIIVFCWTKSCYYFLFSPTDYPFGGTY